MFMGGRCVPSTGGNFPPLERKFPPALNGGKLSLPSERKFPPGGKQERQRTQEVPDASHWPIIINMQLYTMYSVYSDDQRSLHYPLLTICGPVSTHKTLLNKTLSSDTDMWLIHYLSSELSYNRLAATSFINTISYHHYHETTHYNHLTVYYFVIQCNLRYKGER